ncbi:MAG: hypothetical protein E7362_03450 [Clostridiales bacterium]|nr:hypothetical protein [Clostridiales bacterium]
MLKKLISACLVFVMAFSLVACSPTNPPPDEPPQTISVTSVTLNVNNLNLTVGDSVTLIATVQPTDATNKNLTWGSFDETVVTIENGQVVAVGEGETTVFVKTEDGNYLDACAVVVTNETVPEQPTDPVDPPVEPEQPTDPVDPPVEPEQPTEPEDPPVEPEQPTDPVDPPVEPEQPTDPEDPPVEPEQPTEPEDPPVEPEQPTDPEDPPVEPEQPTDPVDPPVEPEQPTDPVDPPVDPEEPTDPVVPPVEPEQPTDPVDPPVDPDEGGDVGGDNDNTEGEDQTLKEWRESILSSYKKFYTFSLDDGVTQDARFIELLNKYGLKGTFNINTGLLGNDTTADLGGVKNPSTNQNVTHAMVTAEEIAGGLYNGHELASHTYSHPSLIRDAVDGAAIKNQITPDVENIKAWTGKEPIGMAYPGPGGYRVWKCTNVACGSQITLTSMPNWCPYCGQSNTFNRSNTEVVLDFSSGMNISATAIQNIKNNTNIKYGRTIENSYNFNLPKDFMVWNPTCSFKDPLLLGYAETFRQLQVEDENYALFYVWGHTYEFDMADPTKTTQDDWTRIEQFLDYMSKTQDAICLTNEEVYLLFADKIPSGTKKYVTMSFDDGATYDEQIANTLNKYGLNATFFINSGVLGQAITGVNGAIRLTETQLVNAINNSFYKGHDIASHGYTHAPGGFAVNGVTQWTHQNIIAEVHNDLAKIETITGRRPIGFAYPGGTTYTNEEVRNVFKYFTYAQFARGTLDTYQFGIPTDWLNWQPTCEVVADNSLGGGFDICALFNEYVNNDRTNDLEVFYMWDHSWAIVMYGKTQIFDNFCNAVDQAKDKVACLTNTEFYKLFACNEV